jgi:hypothetical protein
MGDVVYGTVARSRLRLLDRSWLGARWLDAAGVVLAALVVGGPLIFSHDGFAPDFTNHLWLTWVQSQAISTHLTPTYFLSAPAVGVFYPFFLFYGGTLYAFAGAIGALFAAQHSAGYVISTLLGIVAAYGGLTWLARQLGVRGWMAHMPGVAFVFSAYYVTNLYGRGAWPEAMATSAIPLLTASGWKLLSSPRVTPVPAALLVLSAVVFSGSHNVTLLLGSLVLIPTAGTLWLAGGRGHAPFGWRRVAAVAGLLVLALAVNAWFLLPDAVHASDTQIGSAPILPWGDTGFFNTPAMIFNPLRAVPKQSTTPALYVQAPMWFLTWGLVAASVILPRADRWLRRAVYVVLGMIAVVLAFIMIGPLWDAMPRTIREVQLPFRLNTYVALGVAWLVLLCVVGLQAMDESRLRRSLTAALGAACAVSVGICAWQLVVPTTHQKLFYADRRDVFASPHQVPRTLYDPRDYVDVSGPPIATNGSLYIDPARINSDHMTLTLQVPPGTRPFATNIAAGPYAISVSGGLVQAGRTATGFAALRRAKPGRGRVTFSISPGGRMLVIGRVISLVAILVLLGLLVWTVTRRRASARHVRRPDITTGGSS